jgi:hypothetical protein
MTKNSKDYDRSISKIARWLEKTDWRVESYSGAFVPGSSGETPIPLPPDSLAPLLENFSRTDNVVSYEFNEKGRSYLDVSYTNLGSGQVRVSIDVRIPGLDAPYSNETLLGSISIKPSRSGSFRNQRNFTVEAQSILDGDETQGSWSTAGNMETGYLSGIGLDRGPGGLTTSVDILIGAVPLIG